MRSFGARTATRLASPAVAWPMLLFAAALALALPRAAASTTLPAAGEIVGISSVTLAPPSAANQTATLEITAQILPGWHINSNRPLNPAYIPTRVTVAAPGGVSVGEVRYPPADEVALGFAEGEKLSVFTGAFTVAVPLVADPVDLAAAGALHITIDYQACNDSICLRPAAVSTAVDLGALSGTGAPPAAPADGAVASVADHAGAWLAGVFETRGLVLGLLAVLLGGLALNLTPCVYPLIGVTIAYFGNQGGPPRRVVVLACLFVLGIAITFSALGVVVALSGGLFGSALQNPWVLGALAALLVALALSSFGLFTFRMPSWLVQRAGAARPGYLGALAMGLGMGVVAAPCIGPIIVGLLLMVERSGSALFGFALFFVLSIGLGAPYIGLALAAGSIRRLPRSGEWLYWVEQLFGFVLIGIAIYFLDPLVPDHLMTRILPFYAAAVGIYLGFFARAGRTWRPFLVIRGALGVASVIALVYLAIPRAPVASLSFEPFEPARLSEARAEGKPVLIDFMADWCIPCREMEMTTFVDPKVVSEGARFVKLRADLTRQDGPNQQVIRKFEIQGVPTTMLIDSAGNVRKRAIGYVGPDQLLEFMREVN
jgi:thiol:disulfide interchange protein DsbD